MTGAVGLAWNAAAEKEPVSGPYDFLLLGHHPDSDRRVIQVGHAAEIPFNEAHIRGQEKQALDLVGQGRRGPTPSVCPSAISTWSSCELAVD